MKKQRPKVGLNRETVRRLGTDALPQAAAGVSIGCTASCTCTYKVTCSCHGCD